MAVDFGFRGVSLGCRVTCQGVEGLGFRVGVVLWDASGYREISHK